MMGTIEVTHLGMNEQDMETIADFMDVSWWKTKNPTPSEKMWWTSAIPNKRCITTSRMSARPGQKYTAIYIAIEKHGQTWCAF